MSSVNVDADQRDELDAGWEAARCERDAHLDPAGAEELEWLPAAVPGTAAKALLDAGQWRQGERYDFDAEDWWFRTRFEASSPDAGEEVLLRLGGIATSSEVFLNGVKLLESDSMFASHSIDVSKQLRAGNGRTGGESGPVEGVNELVIRCRALGPMLKQPRKPRARWRTKLVNGGLRFHRTMLLGRAPGFAPGPAAVGPWRPVELLRRRHVCVEEVRLRTSVSDADGESGHVRADGLLCVSAVLRSLHRAPIESIVLALSGPSGEHQMPLALTPHADGTRLHATGMLRVPKVALWWPHTHGQPNLHRVALEVRSAAETVTIDAGRVGFRTLRPGGRPDHDVEIDGLHLHVNGVPVFARGAVWITPDPIGLAPDRESLLAALQRVLDAGMNMLRIPGTGAYESREFHDLCDELGLLLWQDFMFANLDYPIADEHFRATVEEEARTQLAALAGRPSLAVLCGNSEVEQQVAMLGLDPSLGRGELFGELLPRLIAEARSDAVYVPSAPCGGALPFRPGEGIANYFGVGGYRRPIEDARRAEVRFAAECLAFSNVPDEEGVRAVLPNDASAIVVHHPAWKAGVPRDAGSGWDFEDVRDHYLKLIFDVDPHELRRVDHERYLELSRAVTGEVMASVLGEWRRSQSPCGGALLLWLSDLAPGAGWGIVDHSGAPKAAYHHVRRALAPVAVWMIDEGLGGLMVHAANDGPSPLAARLRLSLYRGGEQRVSEAIEQIEMPPHSSMSWDVESLLGHFVDVSWAYRFGPPGQDVVVATLEGQGADGGARHRDARDDDERRVTPEILSQAFHFPAGRPLMQESAQELGLEATIAQTSGGPPSLVLRSRRLVYGVRVHAEGLRVADDAFSIEPGGERTFQLRPRHPGAAFAGGRIDALNLRGRADVVPAGRAP